jgi:hypothetical protein
MTFRNVLFDGLESPLRVKSRQRRTSWPSATDFTRRGCSFTGIPRTSSRPEVGGSAHDIIRIVVVLPAPFGPRKPKHVSAGTSKLIERTASRSR